MNPDDISIPDVLHQAAGIFLDELRGHFKVLESSEKELQALVSKKKSFSSKLADCSKTIADRCHLMKGGAGFLNLTELRETSSSAEKFFLAYDPAQTDGALAMQELTKICECLRELTPALEGALLRKPDRSD